ncbi:MAG: dTMP kinase, partial [Myxococcota bacterium]|nr:dTMP kinase [Myxococcota bacterium]
AKSLLADLSSEAEATLAIKALTRGGKGPTAETLEDERRRFAALWTSETHWARVDAWQSKRMKKEKIGQSKEEQPQGSAGRRGLFISVEGLDGAGTSTQVELLVQWLREQGRMAHGSAEPSDGVIGRQIRELLSGERSGLLGRPIPRRALALLFAADRSDHYENEIEPLLLEEVDVVSDRYRVSSLAYQGVEVDPEWVEMINSPFPHPDLTLYIRVSVETAAARRQARGGKRDHYEVDDFLKQVYTRYESLAARESLIIIDGEGSVEAVSAACRAAVQRWISAQLPTLRVANQPTEPRD